MSLFSRVARCTFFLAAISGTPLPGQRLHLAPHLHQGQSFAYQLEFSGTRGIKVESRVITPSTSPNTPLRALCLLQVHVVQVNASGFRLTTYLSERPSPNDHVNEAAPAWPAGVPDQRVSVFIATDGTASQINGIEQLTPAQQFAWNAWLARFTSAMTFPAAGVRKGQQWRMNEPENTPSPIAGLFWKKEFKYMRDEPCTTAPPRASSGNRASTASSDTCALIFVTSSLRQKSSPKDATPGDYRQRGLATRGAVRGENETVLHISLRTGFLTRSTEDAKQSLNAVVALADGSNQVRYLMNATSHSRIELLPDVPLDVP